MKKMTKKEKMGIVLVIFSFFIGLFLGYLLIPNNKEEELSKTKKNVKDAVVSIETYNGSIKEGTGTGFIYKTSLNKAYIITNEHVVDDVEIKVINSKGKETTATLIGKDNKLDVAILEIDKKYAPSKVSLGTTKNVELGDTIFTVTSPIGKEYQGTVTVGVLSGKDRTVPTSIEDNNEWLMNVLQFDASINPGSSGGPLFDKNGKVIGICSMKLIENGVEGMSFAIPIDQVKENLKVLEKGEEITRPELGIAMTEVSNRAELEERNINIPIDQEQGVVVLEIKEGSKADNKLEKGDIIIQMDNTNITESKHIKYELFKHKIGDTITIKVIRNNKEKSIKITL